MGVLDARLLAPVYSSTDRRFRKLVRIKLQIFAVAGGMHVGKDDLDVRAGDQGIMLGYARDEIGKTDVRILMVGLDAIGKTTILHELNLGAMVTTIATIRFQRRGVQEL